MSSSENTTQSTENSVAHPRSDDPDFEVFLWAFKGNLDAVEMAFMLRDISHTWDDLVDRDKTVDPEHINRMMRAALVLIPANPLYRQFQQAFTLLFDFAINNWLVANELEQEADQKALEIANVSRCGTADILVYMCYVIGGEAWLKEAGPVLRKAMQVDTLAEYMEELAANAKTAGTH